MPPRLQKERKKEKKSRHSFSRKTATNDSSDDSDTNRSPLRHAPDLSHPENSLIRHPVQEPSPEGGFLPAPAFGADIFNDTFYSNEVEEESGDGQVIIKTPSHRPITEQRKYLRGSDEEDGLRTGPMSTRNNGIQEPVRNASARPFLHEHYESAVVGSSLSHVRFSRTNREDSKQIVYPPIRKKPVAAQVTNFRPQPDEEISLKDRFRSETLQRVRSRHPQWQKRGIPPEHSLLIDLLISHSYSFFREEISYNKAAKGDAQNKLEEAEFKLSDNQKRYEERLIERDHEHMNALNTSAALHSEALLEKDRYRIDELNRQNGHYQGVIGDMTRRHEEYVRELKERHEKEIDGKEEDELKLKESHAREKAKLQSEYNQETDELNSDLIVADHKLHAQEEEFKKEFVQQKKAWDDEINSLNQKHKTTQEELVKKNEARIKQMSQEQENKLSQLAEEHVRKQKSLREEVAQYSKALLLRDGEEYTLPRLSAAGLKQEPDENIRAQFLEIVQRVDELGRLEWKKSQKVWSNKALLSLGENQRLVKKSILQDSIWSLLHKHVYCSPFRLFGKEGLTLEKQWNERCGQDPNMNNGIYTWPKPKMDTERWRYVTVSECRKALTEPVPSEFDPRARLKKGFILSQGDLISKLKATLEELVDADHVPSEKVEHLAKRVSKVWLEFGMHRCRILITLQKARPKSTTEKEGKSGNLSLDLDVVPKLGRYGNVNGMELDDYTIIGDCTGERLKLP